MSFVHVHNIIRIYFNVEKKLSNRIKYLQRNRRLNLNRSSRVSRHYSEQYKIYFSTNNWILQKYLWIVWINIIYPSWYWGRFYTIRGETCACGRVCYLVNLRQPTLFVEAIAAWGNDCPLAHGKYNIVIM